jgi:hypothetical protein
MKKVSSTVVRYDEAVIERDQRTSKRTSERERDMCGYKERVNKRR